MKEIDLIKEWIASDILEEVRTILGYELYEKSGISWIVKEKRKRKEKPYVTCAGF